jgi:ankyrin repeat protein
VHALLQHHADPYIQTEEGKNSLMLAASENLTGIIRILLMHHHINPNKTGIHDLTALHFATHRKHIESIYLLLKQHANIDAQDVEGNTPLHYAFNTGNLNTIYTLLQHKASLTIQNNDGVTPQDIAIKNNLFKIMQIINRILP